MKINMRNSFTLLLSGFVCAAQAQTVAGVSEKDFFGDVPIVLSVSRLPQRLDETPGAVTVIDRQMIRLSGARDVADLLRLVPGFRVSNSFESNTPQGTYHGSWGDYANRVQVLVDGRSVYSSFLQGSTGPGLQTVALDDIERIEVLRGSNSASYGARAFLGTINIVTRDPLDTLGVQAQVAGGDNGILDGQVRLGWGEDRASFRLSADRRADQGLSGASGPVRVTRVNLRGDLSPVPGDLFEVRAGQSLIEAGVGFATQEGNAPRTRALETTYAQIDWRRNLGPDQDLAFQLAHTREATRDSSSYAPIPGLVLDAGGQASTDNVLLQHTLRAGADVRVVWGGELRRETVKSRSMFDTDAEFVSDFTRLFGNVEWRPHPRWIVNAGGLYERGERGRENLAPRLMVNWQAVPGHTLRYGLSRAFRPPSSFESFGNTRYYFPAGHPLAGNLIGATAMALGQAHAETVQSREIGYLGDFPAAHLNVDVRVFQEEVRDFIAPRNYVSPIGLVSCSPDLCVRDYSNNQNFDIRGIEFQLNWRPWAGARLVLGHAYVDSGWTDGLTFTGIKQLPPHSSSSLMLMQELTQGINLSLLHHQSDRSNFPGSGDVAPAISRTDVRLAKQLRLGRQRGELALVIQNLGPAYPDFIADFHFRRQAYLSLRLDN